MGKKKEYLRAEERQTTLRGKEVASRWEIGWGAGQRCKCRNTESFTPAGNGDVGAAAGALRVEDLVFMHEVLIAFPVCSGTTHAIPEHGGRDMINSG